MTDESAPKASRAQARARDADAEPVNTGEKQAKGQFSAGQSGNPRGKPPGARHAALAALDVIGQAGAEQALQAVVEQAAGGDVRACEILLRRCWPERRGRPVSFTLPSMNTAGDLPSALAAVAVAVADGSLTPDEAQAVASVLESHRRAIETSNLEKRMDAFERSVDRGP